MNGAVQNRKGDLARRIFLLLAGWLVAVAAVGGVFALRPYVLPGSQVVKWVALHLLCALLVSAFSRAVSRGREGWRWQCLLALLLAPAGALGETHRRYVANPVETDRLHLRSAPQQSAQSLGRFYNGTSVEVLSEKNGFCHVRIGTGEGAIEGYMRGEYPVSYTHLN